MKVLRRTQYGNPILRTRAKNVSAAFLKSAQFRTLRKNMIHTTRRTGGVGIAANQVGVALQIAVMEIRPTKTRPNVERKGPLTIVNPKILSYSKEKEFGWEGCLSFNGVRGSVPRAKSIKASYLDETGKKVIEQMTGLWARIFQHETDHLNGIVYLDRMEDMKTIMTLSEFKKRILPALKKQAKLAQMKKKKILNKK